MGKIKLPPEIEAIGKLFGAQVYKQARVEAAREIKRKFGNAFRGGRFQWQWQLEGHGKELQQTGVRTFTTSELTITTDAFTIPTPITYPIPYAITPATLITYPRVSAQSYDPAWVATAYPTPTFEGTKITLALKRADSRTQTEFGTVNCDTLAHGAIPAGSNAHAVGVVFPTAFAATPVVEANIDNPRTRITIVSVTTVGATFRVDYVPVVATGAVGYSVTGLGDPSGAAEKTELAGGETVTSSTVNLATLPTPGSFSTGGPSDTNTQDTVNTSASTGTASTVNHTHHIANPGTSTDTDNGGVNHTHGVGSHEHHNDHTHGVDDHDHDVTTTDHTHDLAEPPAVTGVGAHGAGHSHTFTGDAENAPSDTPFVIHWTASGGRVVTAASVDVSWMAVGLQAT